MAEREEEEEEEEEKASSVEVAVGGEAVTTASVKVQELARPTSHYSGSDQKFNLDFYLSDNFATCNASDLKSFLVF